jgi:hypothetical protein
MMIFSISDDNLISIIKNFVIGSPNQKECCKNCGLSFVFVRNVVIDNYFRIFCSERCQYELEKKDSSKQQSRLILRIKREERARRRLVKYRMKYMQDLRPTYFLRDPMYEDLVKFIVCTEEERDHFIKLEYREIRKVTKRWELYAEENNKFFWLRYPVGYLPMYIDDEPDFVDDRVYGSISTLLGI